ncbi:hypothetical protein ACPA5B_11745 [Pseudomonas solani]|uniref:hypothetical protein n=1 Tax=Pseudomonas solani TaxID=2731552 RepID=UPI003C2D45A0
MNGKKVTKCDAQAQFTPYFCIQIVGRERQPYGVAGPFKTANEALLAKQWVSSSLTAQGRTDLEPVIWDCKFFDSLELEWDERFQIADQAGTTSKKNQGRTAA